MEKTLSSQATNWQEGRRLRAWELHQKGWKQHEIADALGVTQGAVSQWLKRGREGGKEGLRHQPPPGAPPACPRQSGTNSWSYCPKGRNLSAPRGGVDPAQSGHLDSRPLRGLLSSGSCRPHPEGLRLEQPEASTPSEPEERGNHPTMAGRTLAPDQKKAIAEGRTLVFADQSGFYLLPGKVRTYAPVGQSPVIRAPLSRDHLSAMGGITPGGKLYLMVQERAYRGIDVVRFLKHLARHVSGKLLVLWDGAPIHRSQVVKEYLSRSADSSGAVPQLCARVEPG